MPIYFIDCCFAYGKKLYEYRFASTKREDIEPALKALDSLSFSVDGEKSVAEDLPTGVAGQYSASRQVVVHTPIIPTHFVRQSVMGGRQWDGMIGNPEEDGYYLKLIEIKDAGIFRNKHTGKTLEPTVRSDDGIAKILVNSITHRSWVALQGNRHAFEWLRGLSVSNWTGLQGTKASLYVSTSPNAQEVLSGQYRRSSEWSAILACRGSRKLGEGEVRLEFVEPGSLLAPGLR